MGQTWPFLLMYGSHGMRHTGFLQVDGGQRDPRDKGVTSSTSSKPTSDVLAMRLLSHIQILYLSERAIFPTEGMPEL